MARPRKFETQNERNAAFRAQVKRIDVAVSPNLYETIEQIAAFFEVSKNEVVNSLIRSALTQTDVYKTGLYHYRKK